MSRTTEREEDGTMKGTMVAIALGTVTAAAGAQTVQYAHEAHFVVSVPQVHREATTSVRLIRTVRVPDDGKTYPLPPGLGSFPARSVDTRDQVARWKIPMLQSEAMWIAFESAKFEGYPFRVRVLAGALDAISGEEAQFGEDGLPKDEMPRDPQGFVEVPRQPWLDGFRTAEGVVRQFVAEPLGAGRTVEEQLAGTRGKGGIWIGLQPLDAGVWEGEKELREQARKMLRSSVMASTNSVESSEMGLAPGGGIVQQILKPQRSEDQWSDAFVWIRVDIKSSMQWLEETGEVPPQRPIDARTYTDLGMRWYTYWDREAEALSAPSPFAALKSLRDWAGEEPSVNVPDDQVKDLSAPLKPTAVGK